MCEHTLAFDLTAAPFPGMAGGPLAPPAFPAPLGIAGGPEGFGLLARLVGIAGGGVFARVAAAEGSGVFGRGAGAGAGGGVGAGAAAAAAAIFSALSACCRLASARYEIAENGAGIAFRK